MRDLGHSPFITTVVKEKESLVEKPVSSVIIDEYIRNEAERT